MGELDDGSDGVNAIFWGVKTQNEGVIVRYWRIKLRICGSICEIDGVNASVEEVRLTTFINPASDN